MAEHEHVCKHHTQKGTCHIGICRCLCDAVYCGDDRWAELGETYPCPHDCHETAPHRHIVGLALAFQSTPPQYEKVAHYNKYSIEAITVIEDWQLNFNLDSRSASPCRYRRRTMSDPKPIRFRSVDEFIRHYFPRWWKETKGRPAPTIVVIPRPGVSR